MSATVKLTPSAAREVMNDTLAAIDGIRTHETRRLQNIRNGLTKWQQFWYGPADWQFANAANEWGYHYNFCWKILNSLDVGKDLTISVELLDTFRYIQRKWFNMKREAP
jgi:uncharacterized protein YukE